MTNETKKPRGRPPHEPTEKLRRQVEMMAAFGNTEDQICQIVGISGPTLRLHYRAELDVGFVKANNAVSMNLFLQATKDDARCTQAAMFWLRCRAGWSEYMLLPKPPTKDSALGKKELAALAAQNPDTETSMGELMARRAGMLSN